MDKIQTEQVCKPKNWRGLAFRQTWLIIALVLFCSAIVWNEDLQFISLFLLFMALAIILTYTPKCWVLCPIIIAACSIAMIFSNSIGNRILGPYREAASNTQNICLAVERYANNNDGEYPLDLQVLFDEEYMGRMPNNPYQRHHLGPKPTGLNQGEIDEFFAIKNLSKAPPATAAELEGNFIYIPELTLDPNGETNVSGYCLIGFSHFYKFTEHYQSIPPLAYVNFFSSDHPQQDELMRSGSK